MRIIVILASLLHLFQFSDSRFCDVLVTCFQSMYLSNPRLYEATTTIVEIVPVSALEAKENKVPSNLIESITHKVILKDSLFHPQGGGQPSDKGTLVADDGHEFKVLFASSSSKSGSKINEHFGHLSALASITDELARTKIGVESSTQLDELFSFRGGQGVNMRLDVDLRLLNARLHSAGHTIDAALKRCHGDVFTRLKATKGYHFTDGPYVEYVGELTEKEIKDLPDIVSNHMKEIIGEDIATIVSMVEKQEACTMLGLSADELEFYPEIVRVVEVAGLPCACGGTHVSSTKDLEAVTITKIKKKKNIVRISYSMK